MDSDGSANLEESLNISDFKLLVVSFSLNV